MAKEVRLATSIVMSSVRDQVLPMLKVPLLFRLDLWIQRLPSDLTAKRM